MDNLNNIPNAGNWGDAASKLNDNFNKIKQSLTTVENVSKNNKGYFTSLSALNTAFPSPKAGQTAYVYDEASSTNYYIYNAVNGAWVATSIEAPSVGVDISGYTKTGGSSKTTKEVEDLASQLADNIFYHVDFYTSLGYIRRSDGSVRPSTAYKVTPFMELGTEPIYISNAYNSAAPEGAAAVSFFGADKNYLGEFPFGATGTISNINIPVSSFPVGAVYFRTNVSTSVYPVITGSSKLMDFISELQNSLVNKIDNDPFEKDDLYVPTYGNSGILNLVIFGEYDMTKKYVVSHAGVNILQPSGKFRHYFAISTSDEVYTFSINNTSDPVLGAIETDTEELSVRRLPITIPGTHSVVGFVDIDFSKMVQGSFIRQYSMGILRKSVFQGKLENYILLDNFPFEKGDLFVSTNENKGILNVNITSSKYDINKKYRVKYAGVNRLFSESYRAYLGIIAIGDTYPAPLVEFGLGIGGIPFISFDSIQTGIKRLPLYDRDDLEVGYVDIDFDRMQQGFYTDNIDDTIGILRTTCFGLFNGDEPDVYAPTPTSHRLLLPNDIYFLDEDKVPIYMRSIVSDETLLDSMKLYVGKIDTNFPFLERVWENIEILPSDFDASLRIASKYGKTYASEIIGYYKDLTVHKTKTSDLTGKTATVILSGDSITDYDISGYVNKKFLDKGVTLSFQGTVSDTVSGVVTNNEGRASWEYRNFFGKYTGMNGTAPIYPQPDGSTSTRWLNPFIHIATPSEIAAHPEWCFENHPAFDGTAVSNEKNYTESQADGGYTGDYYTVSIIDYIANHGITVGDKLIWISNWGFNDLNHWNGSEAVILDALMGMEILATRLREYADANPTKQVMLGISPLLIVQVFNKWDRFSSYLERAIIKAKALNTSLQSSNFKIDLVPVWMSVDRSFGWNYPVSGSNVFELNANNDTKYSTPADTLHPGDVGKHQISNVIVNYIAYNL